MTGLQPRTQRLRIVYRSHGAENAKARPAYYSKLLALASVVRAADAFGPGAELVFVNDGLIPADRLRLMAAHGEIVAISAGSNRRSYRKTVEREVARHGPDDEIVWFAEDDYLYRPDAFVRLHAAVTALPTVDYFGLYGTEAIDTAARRRAPRPRREPGGAADPDAVTVDGIRWFRAWGTTSSFGVRRAALREDARVLRLCPFTGGAWDLTTCLVLQGYHPYSGAALREDLLPLGRPPAELPRRLVRGASRLALIPVVRRGSARRVLVSCEPELSLHMDLTCGGQRRAAELAGWAALAADTTAWAAGRAIPIATPGAPDAAGTSVFPGRA